MKKRIWIVIAMVLVLSIALAACTIGGNGNGINNGNGTDTGNQSSDVDTTPAEATQAEDAESNKTEIAGDFAIATDDTATYTVEGNVYTLKTAGTYTLSGTLTGQIYVDAGDDDKVVIELNGVSITYGANSPIYCKTADKLVIKALEGTYNEISDTRALKTTDDEQQGGGAIYAECDLNLAGKGSLVITASYNNGVHTKDDLQIKNVVLKVTAPNNALKGNDSVSIESGQIILLATNGDGIKTENSDVSKKGNQRGTITISGGVININCAYDGIDAAYDVVIEGEAQVSVNTDTYSNYTGTATKNGTDFYIAVAQSLYSSSYRWAAYYYNDDENAGVWAEATYVFRASSGGRNSASSYYCYLLTKPAGYSNVAYYCFQASQSSNSTASYVAKSSGETVNASMNAYLVSSMTSATLVGDYRTMTTPNGNGGKSGSTLSTKGIKADNAITISGGTIVICSTDDAIHANNDVALENGSNGAGDITISGGAINLTSKDDAIHADNTLAISGGAITVATSYEGLEGLTVRISGGTHSIYATNDGINAAGSGTPLIEVSGGNTTIRTATGDTDAIDSNGNYIQTGGFVLVLGGSSQGGMAGSVDVGTETGSYVRITGGTIMAFGGICELPDSASCNYIAFGSTGGMGGMGGPGGMGRWGSQSGGGSYTFAKGTWTVKDASGNTLFAGELPASFSNLWICSDQLQKGSTYTIGNGSTTYTWSQNAQAGTIQ